MTAVLRLADVSATHPGAAWPALRRVSLDVGPGEAVALLGPSGAGKTTALALIDGRLTGWHGSAEVLGRPLSPDRPPPRLERADVGFVFQEFALVDRATARQNVLNGRLGRMRGWAALAGRFSARDDAIARRALADAGISDLADRRADSLSGGQRQRVAIARCLAQEPRLILADEPVSNLDPARAESILGLIRDTARSRGAAVVFSSHQPDLARRFADRIVGMRDGSVAFDRPADALLDNDLNRLYRSEPPGPGPRLKLVI